MTYPAPAAMTWARATSVMSGARPWESYSARRSRMDGARAAPMVTLAAAATGAAELSRITTAMGAWPTRHERLAQEETEVFGSADGDAGPGRTGMARAMGHGQIGHGGIGYGKQAVTGAEPTGTRRRADEPGLRREKRSTDDNFSASNHRPENRAARFSKNACTPSRKSSLSMQSF